MATMSITLFRSLAIEKQGIFLLNLTKITKEHILSQLTKEEIVKILPFLDPSQATEILQHITDSVIREEIIKELNSEVKEKISFLFGFAPQSATGIMDINYIQVPSTATFDTVRKRLKKYERSTGKIPAILVIDDDELKGELPHSVFIRHPDAKVKKIISHIRHVSTIKYHQTSDKILKKLYHLNIRGW